MLIGRIFQPTKNGALSVQFVKYLKRNTHADYNSPLPADAQPVLANGVSLDAPVTLYWSDEFTAGGTGKKKAFYFKWWNIML